MIEDAASYLGSQVPSTMKTAVIIHTPEFKTRQTFRFIEFSADKLTEFLVNEHSFTVVERQNLDVLQKELNFQYSGEVNDKTAVSIGRRLGARCIALGTFKKMGEANSGIRARRRW